MISMLLLIYFFNEDVFDIKGITVNTTYNGGDIDKHYEEAKRIADLCNVSKISNFKRSNSKFNQKRTKVQSKKI